MTDEEAQKLIMENQKLKEQAKWLESCLDDMHKRANKLTAELQGYEWQDLYTHDSDATYPKEDTDVLLKFNGKIIITSVYADHDNKSYDDRKYAWYTDSGDRLPEDTRWTLIPED